MIRCTMSVVTTVWEYMDSALIAVTTTIRTGMTSSMVRSCSENIE